MRSRVLVIVDIVHQRDELRDRLVEFDMLVRRLLHALNLHAQRQHPPHVLVVVRDVKVRLRHVVFDEISRSPHQLPHHPRTRILTRLPAPLHRRPLLHIIRRHHVPRLVPRQRLHPKPPLVLGLRNPLRLQPQALNRPPHRAPVYQHATGTLEKLAHVLDVGVGLVREIQAEALLVVRGNFERAAGAGGAFLLGQPDFAAIIVELLHRADFFVGDGVRGHDGFDVVACGEVGLDAGAAGGGEGSGHGCC